MKKFLFSTLSVYSFIPNQDPSSSVRGPPWRVEVSGFWKKSCPGEENPSASPPAKLGMNAIPTYQT